MADIYNFVDERIKMAANKVAKRRNRIRRIQSESRITIKVGRDRLKNGGK